MYVRNHYLLRVDLGKIHIRIAPSPEEATAGGAACIQPVPLLGSSAMKDRNKLIVDELRSPWVVTDFSTFTTLHPKRKTYRRNSYQSPGSRPRKSGKKSGSSSE